MAQSANTDDALERDLARLLAGMDDDEVGEFADLVEHCLAEGMDD